MPEPASPLHILPGSPDGRYPDLQSGASKWVYDKTEDEEVKKTDGFWNRIDYALVELGDEDTLGGTGLWVPVEDVLGFDGIRVLRPGEGGQAQSVEKQVIGKISGHKGLSTWANIEELARRYVTRGWWAEMRMAPKIKIMKHGR